MKLFWNIEAYAQINRVKSPTDAKSYDPDSGKLAFFNRYPHPHSEEIGCDGKVLLVKAGVLKTPD